MATPTPDMILPLLANHSPLGSSEVWASTTPPIQEQTSALHEYMEASDNFQERVAHVAWAAHILALLSKGGSHSQAQAPLDSSSGEEDDHEDVDVEDIDGDTVIAAALTGTADSIQTKVLDCIAQLFSPAKGWDNVTATAIRQREDFVEIDVARNDSFRLNSGNEMLQGNIPGFALETPEAELSTALTSSLAMAYQTDDYDELPPLAIEFERSAMAYAASRIDHWVRKLQDLLDAPEGRLQEHNGAVSRHSAIEITSWQAITDLLRVQSVATGEACERLVRQAYGFTSSLGCRILLFSIFESKKASKIWSALRLLSRPLADVRMLWQVAGRFPEYRDIRIRPVRRTQQTSISSQYQVDITIAWGRITSERPSTQDIKILEPYRESFRSACSKACSLHAEMQLVDYYESRGVHRPTMDYFGCSKKSCFLCESFLLSLPSPIGTRGRHGMCYPTWGIPCPTSTDTAVALDRLKGILVSRINSYLQNKRLLLLAPVPQSTLVPDFSDSDLEQLTLKNVMVKEALKKEKDSREQQNILKGIGSAAIPLLDPFAPSFEPEDSCVMCNKPRANCCAQCRSCYYCSKNCQRSDWASHKRICRAIAKQPPRPSPSHKRAIFFPVNEDQLQVVWILCERIDEVEDGIPAPPYDQASLGPYFGNDCQFPTSARIELNLVRGRFLGIGLSTWAPRRAGYSIQLKHRDTFLIDGSPLNRSLLASVGTSGTVPHRWCGPLVAMRETYREFYEDITAGDFRHIIDYVTSFMSTETPEIGPDPETRGLTSVRGVKISCSGEECLHGSEAFISVWVPSFHPARLNPMENNAKTSPISQLLGVPIRLWKYADIQTWMDPPGWEYDMGASSNQNAAFLMMETNVKNSEWGWAPLYWNLDLGNVLAVREDGQDLDVDYMRLLCQFVRVKLRPMVEDALGSGTVSRTKEEVRDFITRENLEKFKEEMKNETESS